MYTTMAMVLVGEEDALRWAVLVKHGSENRMAGRYCCEDGHYTPEAAAAHGAELAAAWMVREARRLELPACGALALQQQAA